MDNTLIEKRHLILIYSLIAISLLLNMFIVPSYFPTYSRLINVFIWLIIFLEARNIPNEHNRFKGKKDKMQSVFIIVTIYLIGYYLSGLYFGYNRSAYAKSILGIAQNMFFYVFVIMLQEYTRSRLINNTRSTTMYAIITALLIFLNFDYGYAATNFSTGETAFKFLSSEVYPAIIVGILCSFLVKVGSYQLSLMFLLPSKILSYITPILPDLDWFLVVAFDSALVLLTYYYVYYEHLTNVERFTRKELKKGNPRVTIPSIVFVIVFTLFVAGFFPVQPVALMSNSMSPYIKRGDVVLVKKIKHDDLKKLCVGDIIEYKYSNNSTIVHRIIAIKNVGGNKLEFITKGDANDSQDIKPVTEEQVIGRTRYFIPYIGYPSVIFSEKILNMDAIIDTEKGE